MDSRNDLFLIRPENADCFADLLTQDAAAELADPTTLTIGIARDHLACGAASVAFDPAVGDILSLFVAQSARRQGAGRALLNGIASSAKRMGVKRLQMVCETANLPAMEEFLAATGFVRAQTSPRFRITLEQLNQIELPEVSSEEILPMSELPEAAQRWYNRLAQEYPEQLLSLDLAEIEAELSAFYLTPEDRIGGFTAIAKRADGLELVNTYCAPECIRQLPALFRFSLDAACEVYPPETLVLMDAVTEPSERLLRHLLQNLDIQEDQVDTFILPL